MRKPTFAPSASSMPQTTIYVSPRSLGAPDSRPPAVVTTDLARLFAGSPALAGVSLRIEAGRAVALLGPNGAGKTTLLRVLATAIRPSYGRAAVDGYDLGRDAAIVRERIAYLSHATGLYEDLTARENLRFAASMLGTDDAAARVERALADVGLRERAGDRVRDYSAGMRKRLALGRILLGRASLVLLDEPYAALDAEGMALVDQLLAAWREVGVTVLVASHTTERMAPMLDGSVVLDRGLVAEVSGIGVGSTPPSLPTMSPPVAGRGAEMNALRAEARVALAIARKDALSELRGRHATVSTLFFAAIVLLLFGFALGPDSARLAAAAPGLLWLAVVFAGLLAVSRLHLLETDDGALEQLALYPVSRRAIYAGKALGGLAVMLLLGVLVLGAVGHPLRRRHRCRVAGAAADRHPRRPRASRPSAPSTPASPSGCERGR